VHAQFFYYLTFFKDLPKDFYWTSGSDETNEGNWVLNEKYSVLRCNQTNQLIFFIYLCILKPTKVWMSTQQNVSYINWRANQPDGSRKENCLYLHSRDE